MAIPDARAADPQVPPPEHHAAGVPDAERRLELIANTIHALAMRDFGARAPIGPDGDIIDAVAAGVNFLGEELDASFRDIEDTIAERTAELTAATQELSRLSLHDELTGLPNRSLFWERLSKRMGFVDRRSALFAVMFLDVDEFKAVNDTLGHAVGDRLLIEVASRIRTSLRAGDSAARVGGDEFLVLVDAVSSAEAAMAIAGRLARALGAPYETLPGGMEATVSIGVAIGPERMADADEMVRMADAAMYRAKQGGGGRCALHREERPG